MINCYEILGIPNFSDSHKAKRAYRALAKQYHPDSLGTADYEEQFGVVAKAYATLSNPEVKKWYDQRLTQFLHGHIQAQDATSASRDPGRRRYTKEEWEEFQERIREKQFSTLQKKNEWFAFWKRSALSFLIVLTGAQLIYTNWFIVLNTNMTFMLILGIFLFLLGCIQLVKSLYQWGRYMNFKKGIVHKYEPVSIGIFLVIFLLTPLGIWSLNHFRKTYHLANYGVVETGRIIEIDDNGAITFEFKDKAGNSYQKALPFDPHSIYSEKQKWIVVRYSQADPRIAELVIRKRP